MMSDESILLECYKKLGQSKEAKKKNIRADSDKKMIDGIFPKLSLVIMHLKEDGIVSIVDKQKDIIRAKSYYISYSFVKGRHPECISKSFSKQMDEMIRAVCKHEAEMITSLRKQEIGGDRIDIDVVFSKKANMNRLGNVLARDIVKEEICGINNSAGILSRYFITETGKKYHRDNCPYCKGRYLSEVGAAMVESQKLLPCKCIASLEKEARESKDNMTAFIDESLHTFPWKENGQRAKSGSFSYIICRGRLKNENEINEDRVIADGIDFLEEDEHVERITEAAVGKVLLYLLYNAKFKGHVHIFTDNKCVVTQWKKTEMNNVLSKEFLSVEVCFIPREQNKKADKLGRTRMLMDMPISKYNETVNIIKKVKDIEKKLKEKEEEIRILREQEGVVVVKQLVDLTTPSMTTNVESDTLSL